MAAYAIVRTDFGEVIIASRRGRLAQLLLPGRGGLDPHARARQLLGLTRPQCTPRLLPDLQRRIRGYFRGQRVTFDTPLDLSSLTDFQRAVLLACKRIPYGRTATYADLAQAIGRPQACRAVGNALAHNPIPLVIPCHRVIRADGGLAGFSADRGPALKKRMLELEAADWGMN